MSLVHIPDGHFGILGQRFDLGQLVEQHHVANGTLATNLSGASAGGGCVATGPTHTCEPMGPTAVPEKASTDQSVDWTSGSSTFTSSEWQWSQHIRSLAVLMYVNVKVRMIDPC